jgi:hypothetical protein
MQQHNDRDGEHYCVENALLEPVLVIRAKPKETQDDSRLAQAHRDPIGGESAHFKGHGGRGIII